MFTWEGEHVHSFASAPEALLPRRLDASVRPLAEARDGGLWVARRTEYRIEKWSPQGRLELVVQRAAPWFRPWLDRPQAEGYATQLLPRLVSVSEDDSGLLWVAIRVADSRWAPAPRTREPVPGLTRQEDVVDFIVEVLDVTAGRVLMRHRFDEVAPRLDGDRVLLRYVTDDLGLTTILRSRIAVDPDCEARFRRHAP